MKSKFLSSVSHDIRTPINGIQGMLRIADEYSQDMKKQNECREKMWVATQQLVSLVNNVLDLNRLENHAIDLKEEPFNLIDLLVDLVTMTRMQTDAKGLHCVVEWKPGYIEHRYLIGSAEGLSRILMNLNSNAIKYNKKDGTIYCRCMEKERDGDTIWFEFVNQDTGIGMDEEFLKCAFEPYAQKNNSSLSSINGVGLGLSIVQKTVEIMGGLEATKQIRSLNRPDARTVKRSNIVGNRGENSMTAPRRIYKYQILMIMLCTAFLLYPAYMVSAEEEAAREVIRVGFFAFDGYHMMDEDGNRSGYGYDFLRLAARYMDMDYEYIGYDKSWDEMQEMLKKGEIDLLTSMQKTEDRIDEFDFSKPIGVSSAMLTVKSSNNSILEQEYDTYDGMKVGMLRNNSRNDDFQKLADEKGFTYQPVYYEMESDIKKALQEGEIDAALTSSLRSIHDERVVEKFATRDFYAVVKKGNTKLLDEINYAIDQMNLAEGDWKDELNYQYYGQTESKTLVFSEKEKEIIRQYTSGEKTLTVTCNVDRDPYSYVEDGKLKGIIPDMFAKLMAEAGIPYEIIVPKDRQEYEKWQKDGSVDVFMDARIASESEIENAGAAVTVPYMNFGIAMVTKRDFNGTIKRLAVSEYQGLIGIEDNLVKDAERVTFASREEAMEAVRDGKADAAFVYLYTAQKFVNNDDRGRVTYTTLEEPVYPHRICIMSSAPHELSGILTKCIYAFPDSQMQSLISEYTTYKAENVTLFTLLMLYPVRSMAVVLAVILLLMHMVIEMTKLKGRRRLLNAERERTEEKDVLMRIAQTANESKSRFLFNMSHDIRTPLNAVLGFTTLAKEAIGDEEKERDYLDKIQISGEHLLEIVNDVLEMSRVETGNIKLEESPCCIADVVKEAVIMTEESSRKKKQQFVVDTAELTYPYVLCDGFRVKEILVNLLENAVKFTPEGGKISLMMQQKPEEDTDYVNLMIRVKDNGCGISSLFIEKLFQPFEKEKTATLSGTNGTGLGLAVTKRYIDAMGGEIHVESEEGEGTEFVITLRQKLTEKPKKNTEDPSIEEAKKVFYGKRILIAEDNELNREIEVAILEDAGFIVDEAADGQEALDKVKTSNAGYYAGVLMDIQMPVMDGYEATREIRKLTNPGLAKTPIIAVSANAFDEDKIASEEAGMNAHIAKPIQLDYLFQTLDKILDK